MYCRRLGISLHQVAGLWDVARRPMMYMSDHDFRSSEPRDRMKCHMVLRVNTAPVTGIIEMANIARKDGLIALEGQDIKNHFLAKGIGLLVDSTPTDIIDASLENELSLMKSRHENAALMYRSWAEIAPAMGMIGTLCGLVGMLQNMSDPKAIGPAMAIALLTTLYGALLANVIAKPIAEKLEGYSKDESENCELIMEGIRNIQSGTNPRSMADLLATRLAPKERAALEGL